MSSLRVALASKISTCLFVCVILFFAQNGAAKSLVPNCDYACKQDLVAGDLHAEGSAISSQFVMPDGSVVTNSKETLISSDGIKQTFHQLKKEADRFVQTGQGGSALHTNVHPFVSVPNYVIPPIPNVPSIPYYSSGSSHDSSSQYTKDHELEKKLIFNVSPSSSNSQFEKFQAQNSVHTHGSSQVPCDICAVHTGVSSGSKSDATASYNTIVGNVQPSVASSSYQKYESSSHQKNSTQQAQPILFSNSLKPNTFTTNIVDFNGNTNSYNQNGQGSETQINYHESGSGHVKTEERLISPPNYSGGLLYPSKQVLVEVSRPGVVSESYKKQESSSHVQQSSGVTAAPVPVSVFVQQAESELAKQQQQQQQQQQIRSPVLLGGVPQNVPLESGSHHSSHYYSESSASSSKTVSSSGNSNPVIIHQTPPQKYVSSNGYSSSSSSGSYSQNAPEFYYNGNKIHGASSSIYDNRGDSNVETLCTTNCQPCTTCTYVAGTPVKNTYGVATSYSSQSSTINGKTTENREAAVAVNDNGKVDSYRVKS